MSDCRVPEPQGYDVARLRIEFEGEEIPWMYPLALNGRVMKGVYVDGERYERVRECFPSENGECLSGTDCPAWTCSECGELFEIFAKYCMNCGRKVVSA